MLPGLHDRQHMLAFGCLEKEGMQPSLAAVPCTLPAMESCHGFRALEPHEKAAITLCILQQGQESLAESFSTQENSRLHTYTNKEHSQT